MEEKKIEWASIFPNLGVTLTFSGTETQRELFQEKYRDEDEKNYPKPLGMEKTIKLAKDLGISVTIKEPAREEKTMQKEQIWVGDYDVNEYLRKGWTHVVSDNGSVVKETYFVGHGIWDRFPYSKYLLERYKKGE